MLAATLSRALFKLCHTKNLVYNTCWEDPRLDRQALDLTPNSKILMICSAGCNALDYALDEPERIDAVDVNSRQIALLNLKLAAIRELDFDAFFELFGQGRHTLWRDLYQQKLRGHLPPQSQEYWDKNGKFFYGTGRRPSFYFRGTAGLFAWSMNVYINRVAKIRPQIERLLETTTVAEQSEIYHREVKEAFWGPGVQWFLRRDATLSLLGVPRAQRRQLEKSYPGGIAKFIEDRLDAVFSGVPLHDNYFWRVYLTGEYTHECCPAYLKQENFARLKAGLADRIHTHTTSILDHLLNSGVTYSHFVLLDHMDWLADRHQDILNRQWQAIVDSAEKPTKILWRSAALEVDFVDPVMVAIDGQDYTLGELLTYNDELAGELHARDRVNTYGSFAIATLQEPASTESDHECPGATEDAVSSGALAHSR